MNKIPALFLVALHILSCHALMDTSLLDEVIVKALKRLEDIPRGLSDPAATGTAFLQFGLSQDTAASTHEFREISIYPRTYSQWYERARAQLCMHRHTHAAPRRVHGGSVASPLSETMELKPVPKYTLPVPARRGVSATWEEAQNRYPARP